jgi:MFS transporter, DHA1 family, multidrug resistance protein
MFSALGVNWAGTLLGCVAVVLVPIPVVFIIYGARIRERSAFAPTKPFGMVHPVLPSGETSGTESDAAAAEKVETKKTGEDAV